MNKIVIFLSAAGLFLSLPTLALAQDGDSVDAAGSSDTVYKNNQEINFEGLDVQGEIKKPQGAYLLERKKSKFSPLIKFKLNFDDEVTQSLDQEK